MDITNNNLRNLTIEDNERPTYEYIHVFKNPNKLPINSIHLERKYFVLKAKTTNNNLEIPGDLPENVLELKKDLIPALHQNWLPKNVFYKFEPYLFNLTEEENQAFLTNNMNFLASLEFLLRCNFHQFWCTVLFDNTCVIALRSFFLNPILPYQTLYLSDNFSKIYNRIFNMYILVYKRLITFKKTEQEYMSSEYGMKILTDKKLINLPIVNVLALLYKKSNLDFVNNLVTLYFDDTSQIDFQLKEVEESIKQSLLVLEMIGGYICGFDENAVIVPISIEPKPPVFNLRWIYSVVNYLLNSVLMLNILLQFHRPAVEIALEKNLPFRLPYIYVNIYRELYDFLDDRNELKDAKELSERIFDEMNMGRAEFLECFHIFISYILNKTLEFMGDIKHQEDMIEMYIQLLTTALEDECFICDYNAKYNIASQNEIFEEHTSIDKTRTQFIVECINKLPRYKNLRLMSLLQKQKIENVFEQFAPPKIEKNTIDPQTSSTSTINDDSGDGKPSEQEIEVMINDIMEMLPEIGDGFVMNCLEFYKYRPSEVIDAILEENLPPHLSEMPRNQIRIPPEPEPEQPILAYTGKRPDYDDALKLLNDKSDLKQIKTFVLEGVQYTNNYMYDDEYDDRYDDDVPIKVADNPLEKDVFTSSNPNRFEVDNESDDTSYSSNDDEEETRNVAAGSSGNGERSKMNFCEDPAVIRERREARFKAKRPPQSHQKQQQQQQQKKQDVIGKPKGQGQDANVLKAREKKSAQKSSRANHNRRGGAQWKRSRGMIPS